ncbi:MAG: recombinase family protein [Gemmatimonas sp.]|jgi:DNA invertase Pin-like site-specific DNA recombinase|uniref:recombinase family protein n=1 Tax=Gemmatimonas sp. TaxID=1962908 RepID=UPI0031CBE294|nr:recombinase family protein [Gemmatimonas sp.]MCO4100994.1 recombinase family protein [Gemmatimonas sp.]
MSALLPAKITPQHLQRAAYVYVRQSTVTQVHEHLESQRRQYALAEHARTWGWQQVEVVDDDLGRSGSGRVVRPGFERLVAAVCDEHVGAVFALEASRLARNNRDWHHLVDLCGLTATLLIDGEGVYDPRDFNDRLLLGLKGTMSEWELGVLRQRSLEALRLKASRGELYTTVPIGYVRTRDDRVELDPDLRIQSAIRMIFRQFLALGSLRQVLLWCRSEHVTLPAIEYGPFGRTVVWKLPVYNTIHKLATNPIYAGAYVFGRTKTETRVSGGRASKRTTRREAADWPVFLPDRHPGYITWAEYEALQTQRQENAQMQGRMSRGAPRHGTALLAGLLRCRRCGRRLHVTYSGANGKVRRYDCRGAMVNHGTGHCLSFGSLALERAVEDAIFAVVAPGAIDAALAAAAQTQEQQTEREAHARLALEQLRYEAERARRQYDAVDPANRLVAAELERRWNAALDAVAAQERHLAGLATISASPAVDVAGLRALAEDLPRVWQDSRTDARLKKRLVRTLIEELLVDVSADASRLHVIVRWAGGQHSALDVRKKRKGQHRFCTSEDVVDIVRALVRVLPDGQIAAVLNRLGYTTGRGNTWTATRVVTLRHTHDLPVFDPTSTERDGWCTLEQAAERLDVSHTVIRSLISGGLLPAEQVIATAPWVIRTTDLAAPGVHDYVAQVHRRRRGPPTPDAAQLSLTPSTT